MQSEKSLLLFLVLFVAACIPVQDPAPGVSLEGPYNSEEQATEPVNLHGRT